MEGLTEFLLEEFLSAEERLPPPNKDEKAYNSFTEREHNKRVLRLAEHLLRTGEYDIAFPFLEYKRNGVVGEIDLLLEREEGEAWFEVKFRFSTSGLKKAARQYRNYLKAFPEFSGRAYYISCDGVAIELSNRETLKQFE